MFVSLAFFAMLATSCSKDSLSGVDDTVASASRGSDDAPGDDHGGNIGGGGGEKIPMSKVPAAVLKAFNAKYPSAMNPQWKKLDNGNYKVEFYLNSVKWQSVFSPSGTLLKQETH